MIRKKNLARPVDEFAAGNGDNSLEDLTVLPADDPELGLTNIGSVPPEDWAADTGPAHTAEEGSKGVDDELEKDSETPAGGKIDF